MSTAGSDLKINKDHKHSGFVFRIILPVIQRQHDERLSMDRFVVFPKLHCRMNL